MLKWILPDASRWEDIRSFYEEIEQSGGACIGFGNRKDAVLWLTDMQNRLTGKNLPEGYVRENFYLCYEGDTLAGVFSLKFALTDYLRDFGGHIGYAVRPSMRCRGLATQMLREGKEIAAGLGFDRLLCVCDKDNPASARVIVKNGGVLGNELYDPEEKVVVQRYWISLP